MTRQEKLILLIVSMLLLGRLGLFAKEVIIASHYGVFGPPPVDTQLWKSAYFLLSGLLNLGATVWLFVESKAAGLRAWVWSLLGLFFGLSGIALFYLVQIYNSKNSPKT